MRLASTSDMVASSEWLDQRMSASEMRFTRLPIVTQTLGVTLVALAICLKS